VPVANGLAYIYAEKFPTPENLGKAVKVLTSIPEKLRNAQVLDTLGWIYYKKKEYPKAQITLEQAISQSKRPIIEFYLGIHA